MKVRSLRRHFIRTLISMMAATLFVIAVEAAMITYSMWRMDRDWPRFVAYDYVNKVMLSLEGMEEPGIENFLDTFTDSMDNRVSGVLIRNVNDGALFLYGKTPDEADGEETRELKRLPDDTQLKTFTKRSPIFDISVTLDGETYEPTLSVRGVDNSYSSVNYTVPEFINRRDIAGTIFFFLNDEMIASFDLLVINMRSIESARYVLDAAMLTLVWMLPICLVVSLIVSFFISRRSSRSLEGLQSALASLARGSLSVEIAPQNTYELNEIAKSIKELDADLKKNRLARQEWIRSIAHDLNTPLTSINLMVEGLCDGVFQPDEAFLASLKGEIRTLSGRVETVRYYAGLLDPEKKLALEDADLAEAAEEALGRYDRSRYDFSVSQSKRVEIDRPYFTRAVKEIVDNALNASGEGKISIRVLGNTLEVVNRGSLPKDHPDLFEPWSRGDRSRHSGGSGLGLPIVGQIMTLHDARIVISEKDGQVVARLSFKEAQT